MDWPAWRCLIAPGPSFSESHKIGSEFHKTSLAFRVAKHGVRGQPHRQLGWMGTPLYIIRNQKTHPTNMLPLLIF